MQAEDSVSVLSNEIRCFDIEIYLWDVQLKNCQREVTQIQYRIWNWEAEWPKTSFIAFGIIRRFR